MFVCLFVCLFVGINPEKICFASCWEGIQPPGSDYTRAEALTTCIPKTAVQTTYLSIYDFFFGFAATQGKKYKEEIEVRHEIDVPHELV